MSTKEKGQVANTTPDPSVCQRPEPPLHQGSFTSAPYCSRDCTCQRRRRRNEQNQAVREWIPEREFLEMYRFWHLRSSETLNDSGFHSSSDSDKENKP